MKRQNENSKKKEASSYCNEHFGVWFSAVKWKTRAGDILLEGWLGAPWERQNKNKRREREEEKNKKGFKDSSSQGKSISIYIR